MTPKSYQISFLLGNRDINVLRLSCKLKSMLLVIPRSLLGVIMLFAQFLSSQEHEATLILLDSTEFDGYAYVTHTDYIQFRMDLESKPDKWGPDMVRAIEFDTYDERIVLEYVHPKERLRPVLMRVLEPGFMTLYGEDDRYTANFGPIGGYWINDLVMGINAVRLFVKRKDQNFMCKVKANPKSWKKTLEKCFKGCPELINGLKDESLKDQSIMDLVWHFNEYCADYSEMEGNAKEENQN